MFFPFFISKRLILLFLLFYFLANLIAVFYWGGRSITKQKCIHEEPETQGQGQSQRQRQRRSLGGRQAELEMLKMQEKSQKKAKSSFSSVYLGTMQKENNISSIRAGFKYPAYPKPWKLINMTVSYLLNNYNICGDPRRNPVKILIIIHSQAGNIKFRNAFRSGLLKQEMEEVGLRRLFVLADPNAKPSQTTRYDLRYDSASLADLLEENSVNSDMIIGDFHDTYRNLTYKHVMGLEWAKRYCAHAKYILKQDDDTFVDYYQILTLLRLAEKARKSLNNSIETERLMNRTWSELSKRSSGDAARKLQMVTELTMITQHGGDPRFIIGNVNYQVKPRRDKNQDWFVTRKEWPRRLYPNYVPGFTYITNIPTINDLLWKSKDTIYFWIDDIFVTGVLRVRAKVPFIDIKYLFTMNAHREIDACSSPLDIPSAPPNPYNAVMKILKELSPNWGGETTPLGLLLPGIRLPQTSSTSSSNSSSSSSSTSETPSFVGKWCNVLAGVRAKKKLLQVFIPFMNHARFCYKTHLCTFIQD